MKTPKEFNNNLESKTITSEMLAVCLYSVNKRAKNCRDKQAHYMDIRHNYYWRDKYGNEDKYREKKEEYYSYKDKLLSLITPRCIHTIKRTTHYEFFLYYEVNDYSFHSPIKKDDVKKEHSDLQKIEIGDLKTFGRNINDLISVQFVKKVIALIDSGDYVYVSESKHKDMSSEITR